MKKKKNRKQLIQTSTSSAATILKGISVHFFTIGFHALPLKTWISKLVRTTRFWNNINHNF
jgi:hypothetical protein